eukprot:3930687-Pyramimonas_sp.AAC.1
MAAVGNAREYFAKDASTMDVVSRAASVIGHLDHICQILSEATPLAQRCISRESVDNALCEYMAS